MAAVQRNLNQLYTNQKAVSDMGYTNNVHVHVLRKFVQEKLGVTAEEYDLACEAENKVRDEIRRRQIEEDKAKAEEAQNKQVEAAIEKAKKDNPVVESKEEPRDVTVRPVIFGGDLGGEDAEGSEQSGKSDEVHNVQDGDGSAPVEQERGEGVLLQQV